MNYSDIWIAVFIGIWKFLNSKMLTWLFQGYPWFPPCSLSGCGLDWKAYLKCSSEYLHIEAEENFQKTTWQRHLQMGMGDTKLCVNISQSSQDSALSEAHILMSKEGAVGSVPGEAFGKDASFVLQQSRWRSTNCEPHHARNSGVSSTLPLNSSQMHTREHPSYKYTKPI